MILPRVLTLSIIFKDHDITIQDAQRGGAAQGSEYGGAISPFMSSATCNMPPTDGTEKENRHANNQPQIVVPEMGPVEVVPEMQEHEVAQARPRRVPRREEDAGVTLDPEVQVDRHLGDLMPPSYDVTITQVPLLSA